MSFVGTDALSRTRRLCRHSLACAAAAAMTACAAAPSEQAEVHMQRYPGVVSGVYQHPAPDRWSDGAAGSVTAGGAAASSTIGSSRPPQ